MLLADPTLAPAATHGVVWLPADVATALCDPATPETGERPQTWASCDTGASTPLRLRQHSPKKPDA